MSDLDDLFELAEEAMSYTDKYFREKWEMDSRLTELRKRLLTPASADGATCPRCHIEKQSVMACPKCGLISWPRR